MPNNWDNKVNASSVSNEENKHLEDYKVIKNTKKRMINFFIALSSTATVCAAAGITTGIILSDKYIDNYKLIPDQTILKNKERIALHTFHNNQEYKNGNMEYFLDTNDVVLKRYCHIENDILISDATPARLEEIKVSVKINNVIKSSVNITLYSDDTYNIVFVGKNTIEEAGESVTCELYHANENEKITKNVHYEIINPIGTSLDSEIVEENGTMQYTLKKLPSVSNTVEVYGYLEGKIVAKTFFTIYVDNIFEIKSFVNDIGGAPTENVLDFGATNKLFLKLYHGSGDTPTKVETKFNLECDDKKYTKLEHNPAGNIWSIEFIKKPDFSFTIHVAAFIDGRNIATQAITVLTADYYSIDSGGMHAIKNGVGINLKVFKNNNTTEEIAVTDYRLSDTTYAEIESNILKMKDVPPTQATIVTVTAYKDGVSLCSANFALLPNDSYELISDKNNLQSSPTNIASSTEIRLEKNGHAIIPIPDNEIVATLSETGEASDLINIQYSDDKAIVTLKTEANNITEIKHITLTLMVESNELSCTLKIYPPSFYMIDATPAVLKNVNAEAQLVLYSNGNKYTDTDVTYTLKPTDEIYYENISFWKDPHDNNLTKIKLIKTPTAKREITIIGHIAGFAEPIETQITLYSDNSFVTVAEKEYLGGIGQNKITELELYSYFDSEDVTTVAGSEAITYTIDPNSPGKDLVSLENNVLKLKENVSIPKDTAVTIISKYINSEFKLTINILQNVFEYILSPSTANLTYDARTNQSNSATLTLYYGSVEETNHENYEVALVDDYISNYIHITQATSGTKASIKMLKPIDITTEFEIKIYKKSEVNKTLATLKLSCLSSNFYYSTTTTGSYNLKNVNDTLTFVTYQNGTIMTNRLEYRITEAQHNEISIIQNNLTSGEGVIKCNSLPNITKTYNITVNKELQAGSAKVPLAHTQIIVLQKDQYMVKLYNSQTKQSGLEFFSYVNEKLYSNFYTNGILDNTITLQVPRASAEWIRAGGEGNNVWIECLKLPNYCSNMTVDVNVVKQNSVIHTFKVLLLNPFPFNVKSDTGSDWDGRISGSVGFTFDDSTNTCTLNKEDNFHATNLVIPDYISHKGKTYKLTGIGTANSSLGRFIFVSGSITIGDFIRDIQNYGFKNAGTSGDGITEINLGRGVQTIGASAFEGAKMTNNSSVHFYCASANFTVGSSAFLFNGSGKFYNHSSMTDDNFEHLMNGKYPSQTWEIFIHNFHS